MRSRSVHSAADGWWMGGAATSGPRTNVQQGSRKPDQLISAGERRPSVALPLTAATSSDSIWALSACLFILNALLADYTALRPQSHRRERCVRTRRLAYGIERRSDQVNVGFVYERRYFVLGRASLEAVGRHLCLWSHSLLGAGLRPFSHAPPSHSGRVVTSCYGTCLTSGQQGTARTIQVILTIVLCGLSTALTYPLSATATYLYLSCFIFVTFIAPGMLVWAQRFKK